MRVVGRDGRVAPVLAAALDALVPGGTRRKVAARVAAFEPRPVEWHPVRFRAAVVVVGAHQTVVHVHVRCLRCRIVRVKVDRQLVGDLTDATRVRDEEAGFTRVVGCARDFLKDRGVGECTVGSTSEDAIGGVETV